MSETQKHKIPPSTCWIELSVQFCPEKKLPDLPRREPPGEETTASDDGKTENVSNPEDNSEESSKEVTDDTDTTATSNELLTFG